jgi:hypothetical protein
MSVKPEPHGAGLVQEATSLLAMSAGSWSSAGGVLDTWDDERLLNEGRGRYHGHAPESGDDDQDALSSLAARSKYRFWARSAPWYLRLKRDTNIPHPDRRNYPEDIVVSGVTWFARHNARSFSSNEGRANSQIGVENLDLLLHPETLSTAISVTSAQETSVAGRPAIELRIEPTEQLLWAAAGLIALGAGSYILLVDREAGILLATHVYVDGKIARSHALSALTFNGPIPGALYVPNGWMASAPVLPPWTG